MAVYRRDDSLPDTRSVHDGVESELGREIEGVVVDEEGLKRIILADGDSLTDEEKNALEQRFDITLEQV